MQDYPKHDMRMEGDGLHKVCAFDVKEGMTDKCPHIQEVRDHTKKIKDNITDCVGNTPMVRVSNLCKMEGIKCDLLAKCEFLNPGGSVKDRIGRRMIFNAMKEGRKDQGGKHPRRSHLWKHWNWSFHDSRRQGNEDDHYNAREDVSGEERCPQGPWS